MTDAYLTVSSPSSEELLINKSRFIGYAAPCGEEPAALAFLQGLRDQHKGFGGTPYQGNIQSFTIL